MTFEEKNVQLQVLVDNYYDYVAEAKRTMVKYLTEIVEEQVDNVFDVSETGIRVTIYDESVDEVSALIETLYIDENTNLLMVSTEGNIDYEALSLTSSELATLADEVATYNVDNIYNSRNSKFD